MKPIAVALLLALACGCVTAPRIAASKSTVLGLDISTDSGGLPHVRLGLIRYFYQELPVSTNAIHVPNWSADVSADVGLTRQTAHETFTVKQP